MLIYVQMVLLFQEKNRRVYGQLAMFSLLQVVVAALLNSGLEYGVLLSMYMVIALLGFVLFFVYREVGRVGMVTRVAPGSSQRSPFWVGLTLHRWSADHPGGGAGHVAQPAKS